MFPTHLQSLAEVCSRTREQLRKKRSLYYCNILFFSEIRTVTHRNILKLKIITPQLLIILHI